MVDSAAGWKPEGGTATRSTLSVVKRASVTGSAVYDWDTRSSRKAPGPLRSDGGEPKSLAHW